MEVLTHTFNRAVFGLVLAVVLFSYARAHAAIVPSGYVTPTYNGVDDPWAIPDYLIISQAGEASLTITVGSAVSAQIVEIGNGSTASATVMISDAGSELDSTSYLKIGRSGTAVIEVSNGGTLSGDRATVGEFVGSSGTVTVSDPGSTWVMNRELFIGEDGNGAVNLINGGAVITNDVVRLSYELQSVSTAQVSGTGSTWNAQKGLVVGWGGVATLDILDGGLVTGTNGYMGEHPGAIGLTRVHGEGSAWTLSGGIFVGEEGEGGLVIEQGAYASSYRGEIGRSRGSVGAVTVSGEGSKWDVDNNLVVGGHGTGSLRILDGAEINSGAATLIGNEEAGSGRITFDNGTLNTGSLFASPAELLGTGTINTNAMISDVDMVFDQSHGLVQQFVLNGLPDQNIVINLDASDPAGVYALGAGYRGAGSLTIAEGRVMTSSIGALAYKEGSTVTATVSGPGTAWHATEGLTIGRGGDATLVTQGGALITTKEIDIASRSGAYGSAIVSGNPSKWEISELIRVGRSGAEGLLRIEQGGTIDSDGRVIVGVHEDAIGTATVVGEGSTWRHTGEFNIGWSGKGVGTLNIENGALVDIDGGLLMKSPDATVNLNGGTLVLHGEWSSRNPVAEISGGTLNFTGGRLEGADHIFVQEPFVQAGGTLAPGNSIGESAISNDYVLDSGIIEIEIGGADNTHDTVALFGDIAISATGTTLDLKPIGSMAAGTYTIFQLDKGTLSGDFEHITGLGMYAGLVDVQYSAKTLKVTLNWDYVPGDLNADGFVGIDDLNTILTHWNQFVPVAILSSGDVSGDGFVGIDDLNAVLVNWNTGAPPAGGAGPSVPEPSAALLMLCGVGVLSGQRSPGKARG